MAVRIEICAPLGTGKSVLAKALAQHQGWTLVEEPVANHPFLADFYKDPQKHAFESAAFFALAYINNVKKTLQHNTIFDAGNILNQSYYALPAKTPEEKAAMDQLDALADSLPKPDLILYLNYPSEKILKRVQGRGRSIENGIPESYIQDLQQEIRRRLNDPANKIPVLTINMEEFDVLHRPEDVQKISKLIAQKLTLRPITPSAPQP